MTQMHVQVLGEFRLSDGSGNEIPIRSPKLRALITYLALHPDQPIKREALASLLWGDNLEAQARQSLRQALLSLRKTLGNAAIETDDETVTFRSVAVRTDVAVFESDAAEGRLNDAVTAYHGDLMVETAARSEAFEVWLDQERTRLRNLACRTLRGAWVIAYNKMVRVPK